MTAEQSGIYLKPRTAVSSAETKGDQIHHIRSGEILKPEGFAKKFRRRLSGLFVARPDINSDPTKPLNKSGKITSW